MDGPGFAKSITQESNLMEKIAHKKRKIQASKKDIRKTKTNNRLIPIFRVAPSGMSKFSGLIVKTNYMRRGT